METGDVISIVFLFTLMLFLHTRQTRTAFILVVQGSRRLAKPIAMFLRAAIVRTTKPRRRSISMKLKLSFHLRSLGLFFVLLALSTTIIYADLQAQISDKIRVTKKEGREVWIDAGENKGVKKCCGKMSREK